MLNLKRDFSAVRRFFKKRRLPRLFLVATLCLSGVARAQSGGTSVKVSGGVSRTVALSLPEAAGTAVSGVRITSSQNPDRSLSITLSGDTRCLTEVIVPVHVRSNTAYRLFAAAKAGGSNLSGLLIVDARPTGNLVAADAVEALIVSGMFDGRRRANKLLADGGFNRPNLSAPSELLGGPRVSLGGTLGSPQNALEVALSVAVEPHADDRDWVIELLLSATPAASL